MWESRGPGETLGSDYLANCPLPQEVFVYMCTTWLLPRDLLSLSRASKRCHRLVFCKAYGFFEIQIFFILPTPKIFRVFLQNWNIRAHLHNRTDDAFWKPRFLSFWSPTAANFLAPKALAFGRLYTDIFWKLASRKFSFHGKDEFIIDFNGNVW